MKKSLSLLLILVLVMTVFAGCGEKKSVTEDKTGTTQEDEKTDTGKASGEQTTVKLALWDYDVDGSVYPAIIEAFEKANPDIKVTVVSSSNADYETKLTTMLSGGDNIDVFFAKSNTVYPTMVLKSFALDLTTLIADNNYDLTAYGTVLDQHYKINDKLYALPFRTNDWVVYYNKTLFDNAGVDYPTNDMTWEEFAEIGKSVTSGDNYGIGFIPKPGFIVPMLVGAQDGFDIANTDYSTLQYPLEYMLKIMNEDKSYEEYAQSKSMNQDQTYFYKGTTGMLFNGSWFTQMLNASSDSIDFEWGVVKSPYWEGTEQKGFATSTPVLINSSTDKKEASWKLLTFLTGEEGAKLVAGSQLIPSYVTDEVMNIYKESTKLDESSMEALTNNATYALGESSTLLGLLSDAINNEVDLVMTNNESPEDAVKNMEDRRKEIIEANK